MMCRFHCNLSSPVLQKVWSGFGSSPTDAQRQELCLKTFIVGPPLPLPSFPSFSLCPPSPPSLFPHLFPVSSLSPLPLLPIHVSCCFLQFMLKEWASELNARPMTEKRSYQVYSTSVYFHSPLLLLVEVFCNSQPQLVCVRVPSLYSIVSVSLSSGQVGQCHIQTD